MLLYQQIRHHLAALIQQGAMRQNSKLPSERELLEQFKSTRITVREALLRLEAEGIIYRQNRKGWFVCPPRLVWNPVRKVNFYELAKQQGFKAQTKVVEISRQWVQGEVAEAFGENTLEAFNLVRVRSLDGRAVMLEEITCPLAICATLDKQDLSGSVTQIILEQGGVEVTHERSQVFVTTLPDDYAPQLEQNSGAPCLRIVRKRYDKHDALVDYNIEYWLHSAIEMQVEGL